jgi:hypothetical protein
MRGSFIEELLVVDWPGVDRGRRVAIIDAPCYRMVACAFQVKRRAGAQLRAPASRSS